MKTSPATWFLTLVGIFIVVYLVYEHNIVHGLLSGLHCSFDEEGTVRKPKFNTVLRKEDIMITQETFLPPLYVPPHIQILDQTHPKLAEYISSNWIFPPSKLSLNLTSPNHIHYSQANQSKFVDNLLNGRENGFFIECGAFNGETFSNSLFFEKYRKWSGVLIEADSKTFADMRMKHRHAYLMNVCLSPVKRTVKIPFRVAGVIGGLSEYLSKGHAHRIQREQGPKNDTLLQCFPMFSILKAIGVTHVDFFSLDIESAEADVVDTLPLDQMTVDVFVIEHNNDGEKRDRIVATLVDKHGYVIAMENTLDIALVHKDLKVNSISN